MSRLDKEMLIRQLVQSRSQAENLIKLGQVKVNSKTTKKPGYRVQIDDLIELTQEKYVSRSALKLKSAVEKFNLDFQDSIVLDVGSSTGGFTDYTLQHGAKKVVAVDVGTEQLHPTLRRDERIELHEKTDINDFTTDVKFNYIVIDVSFVSLRKVLPSVFKLATKDTQIVAMLKPQFEAGNNQKHKGVIKNNRIRRDIVKEFEAWIKQYSLIIDKHDSDVSGKKGNVERFYLLKLKV
jgi:23S rRNA (cytidine1920-2'-O)/16S rRNA (cytidine1409-2'-O)-methyltransferase